MGGGASIEQLNAEELAAVAEDKGKSEVLTPTEPNIDGRPNPRPSPRTPHQVAAIILAKNIDGELAAEIEGDDECFKEAADGSHLGECTVTSTSPPIYRTARNRVTSRDRFWLPPFPSLRHLSATTLLARLSSMPPITPPSVNTRS